jgi:hypothetical protein
MEDKFIAEMDLIIAKYNPCKLDGHGCMVNKDNPCCFNTAFKREDPNDIRCLHLGKEGECLHRNLACKAWFCETCVKAMEPECLKAVLNIEAQGKEANLITPPFIGDHYYGADKVLN